MIMLHLPYNLQYNFTEGTFNVDSDRTNVLKYLKGLHPVYEDFHDKFLYKLDLEEFKEVFGFLKDNFDKVKPFTYDEVFKLKNVEFQALVFGTIDITEMISNLGHTRIKTAGIEVKRKIFSKEGEFIEFKDYHNVYETYEVSGEKLNLDTNVYAIKCWCTSTNQEHWLWIEEQYKDDPLSAIASTFRIHENLIPHIKELKRQGDIMLVEMKEEVEPSGNIVPLTKDQYFGLLTSET